MKTRLDFWVFLFCAGFVLSGCCEKLETPSDSGNEKPPVEQPEELTDKPLTDGSIFNIQIDDIMATIGSSPWTKIIYGNGKYVAVSSDPTFVSGSPSGSYQSLAYSLNGIFWLLKNLQGNSIYDIIYANGKFVAVGYGGNIWYSTNGTDWTLKEDAIDITTAYGIAYGNGKYVVSGNGCFSYSTDGINWTKASDSTNSYYWGPVAFGNGKFIVIPSDDAENKIASSEDGISWTFSSTPSNQPFNDIVFGKGVFVISSRNYTGYSTDGISWTRSSLVGSSLNPSLSRLSFGQGLFLGCWNNRVYISADGKDWMLTEVNSTDNLSIRCVCIKQ